MQIQATCQAATHSVLLIVATSAFAADAQGNPTRGIDTAADILGVSYTTTAGLSGITDAIADGSLRVGLHVRAIGVLGGSDGYVKTGGPAEVPEPCSASAVSVSLDTDDDGQRENPPRFRGTTDVECVLPIGVAHGRDSRQTGEHERKRVRENGNSGKMTMLPAVQYGIFDQKWSTDDMFSSV